MFARESLEKNKYFLKHLDHQLNLPIVIIQKEHSLTKFSNEEILQVRPFIIAGSETVSQLHLQGGIRNFEYTSAHAHHHHQRGVPVSCRVQGLPPGTLSEGRTLRDRIRRRLLQSDLLRRRSGTALPRSGRELNDAPSESLCGTGECLSVTYEAESAAISSAVLLPVRY